MCGRENPLGLAARWMSDAARGEVRATLEIPEHFNGFPGIVHGGILGSLLDEAAVRTALLDGGFDDLMVTAKLEVAFHRPTPTRTPVTVVGRLVKRARASGSVIYFSRVRMCVVMVDQRFDQAPSGRLGPVGARAYLSLPSM